MEDNTSTQKLIKVKKETVDLDEECRKFNSTVKVGLNKTKKTSTTNLDINFDDIEPNTDLQFLQKNPLYAKNF